MEDRTASTTCCVSVNRLKSILTFAHYLLSVSMGISRDHWHKRRATGGKRAPIRNKRKFELARPAAMTKLGPQRIHTVRVRGGNKKYRALRLDAGNFSWGSEAVARKTRIIDVVYNACNSELVRTKTLVKNAIVVIDATPFRQWYEAHYALPLGHKKGTKLSEADEAIINKKRSKKTEKKYKERQKEGKVTDPYTIHCDFFIMNLVVIVLEKINFVLAHWKCRLDL